jgi:hypothetical protein
MGSLLRWQQAEGWTEDPVERPIKPRPGTCRPLNEALDYLEPGEA